MNEQELWLEQRKKGLGGSDAPAACGVSRWKTPLMLYLEKRGEAPPVLETPAMSWGTILEPSIRNHYMHVTGLNVLQPKTIIAHPKHEWMIASLDGIATRSTHAAVTSLQDLIEARVLEIKTARTDKDWGEPGTDEIPEEYLVQVQHYLAVTGLRLADVATLIGGSDFRIYTIDADPDLQDLIINREFQVWNSIVKGTPPDPITQEDMRLAYKKSTPFIRQANEEMLATIERLKEIKQIIAEEDNLKTKIMGYLGEADTLASGEKVLATWKNTKGSKRFDQKEFKDKHPKLYEEFLKEGEPQRRFLLK